MKIPFTLHAIPIVLLLIVTNKQIYGNDEEPTWPDNCKFIHHEKTEPGAYGYKKFSDIPSECDCEAACAADNKCGTYKFFVWEDEIECSLVQATPKLVEILTGIKAENWLYRFRFTNTGVKDCDAIIPVTGPTWVGHDNKKPDEIFKTHDTLQMWWDRPLSVKQCQKFCTGWSGCHSVTYAKYGAPAHITHCTLNSVGIRELYETNRGGLVNVKRGVKTFDRPLRDAEGGFSLKRSAQDTQPSFGEEHRSLTDANDKTQNTLDGQPGQDLVVSSKQLDKDGAGSQIGESDYQAPAPESPGA